MHSWWLNANKTSDNNKEEVAYRDECSFIKSLFKLTLSFRFSITQSKKNILKSKQLMKLIFDDNIDVNQYQPISVDHLTLINVQSNARFHFDFL